MAKAFEPRYYGRLNYRPNATTTYKFNRDQLVGALLFDLNGKANQGTNAASGISFGAMTRLMQRVQLVMGSKNIWDMSGEGFFAKFGFGEKGAAPEQTNYPGTASTNNQAFSQFFRAPFTLDDGIEPFDCMMDTRGRDFELRITWRNMATAGAVFGTPGDLTFSQDDIYIDLSGEAYELRPSQNGAPNALTSKTPLIRGLIEQEFPVVSTNATYQHRLPGNEMFRKVTMVGLTTSSNQETSTNAILTDRVELRSGDTRVHQNWVARTTRQMTKINRGVETLPAGIYDLDIIKYGRNSDVLASSVDRELYLQAAVAPTGTTSRVLVISDTLKQQTVN